jgi:hypothetical protein
MEQQIMAVWGMCEELDLLMEGVMEKDMSRDDICNALLGLKVMHQLKSEKLFDTFEKLIRDGRMA